MSYSNTANVLAAQAHLLLLQARAWDPSLHPRAEDGRFGTKAAIDAPAPTPEASLQALTQNQSAKVKREANDFFALLASEDSPQATAQLILDKVKSHGELIPLGLLIGVGAFVGLKPKAIEAIGKKMAETRKLRALKKAEKRLKAEQAIAEAGRKALDKFAKTGETGLEEFDKAEVIRKQAIADAKAKEAAEEAAKLKAQKEFEASLPKADEAMARKASAATPGGGLQYTAQGIENAYFIDGKLMPTKLGLALEEIEEVMPDLDLAEAVVLNDKGKVLLRRSESSSNLGLADEAIERLAGQETGVIITRNKLPEDGAYLSDLKFLAKAKAQELRLVTKEGIYRLRAADTERFGDLTKEVEEKIGKLIVKVQMDFARQVLAKKMTIAETTAKKPHAVWSAIANEMPEILKYERVQR